MRTINHGSPMATRPALVAGLWASCLLVLSGCASMKSTTAELQNLRADEGIVFGSVIINVATGTSEGSESGWAFLQGQKAGDAEYDAVIWENSLNPLSKSYLLAVTPGIEANFVKKLAAGNYEIKEIQKKGFSSLVLYVGAVFTVYPGQITYIGQLEVQLPDRITLGSPVRKAVVDTRRNTAAKLEAEYGLDFTSAAKALMTLKK